jgi:hypothetical protein
MLDEPTIPMRILIRLPDNQGHILLVLESARLVLARLGQRLVARLVDPLVP